MTVRIVSAFLLIALVALLAPVLPAQTAAAPPQPTPSVGTTSSGTALTSYTLTPEQREKAIAYARARYGLHFFAFFWSVLVLILIIRARLGPRFRDRAESMTKRRFGQAAIFVPLLLITESLLELPTAAWGQRLARLYGQSVQGWGSWLWDAAKGLIVAIVVA